MSRLDAIKSMYGEDSNVIRCIDGEEFIGWTILDGDEQVIELDRMDDEVVLSVYEEGFEHA